jgi:cytochrome c
MNFSMGKLLVFILAGMLLWQDNHAPVVKIEAPKAGVSGPDVQVHYVISVSDKEDGDLKYDEINSKEILLEVRYVRDEAGVQAALKKGVKDDPRGLALLRTSNCFNCHSFDSRGIGPSFFEVSKRYPLTVGNVSQVAKRIREGSTGVWGKVSMPTHPELRQEEAEEVARWVLQNAGRPDVSYYVGGEGFFRIKASGGSKRKGSYVLTASYMDHGLKDDASGRRLKGQDVVVVRER